MSFPLATPSPFKAIKQASVSYQIPTDFADLQTAIDALSKFRATQGKTFTLNIESGHAPASGFTVENGDYSHIVITSTDAVVTLGAGWVAGDPVARGVNARMPQWGVLIDCNAEDCGIGAVRVELNSDLKVLDGCGARNNGAAAGANLYVYRNSKVSGDQTDWAGATDRNVWVTHRSDAYLERGDFSGAGAANVFVSRLSNFYGIGGNYDSSGEEGLLVRRSFAACFPFGAADVSFDSNGTAAIAAYQGSKVIAHARNGQVVNITNALVHGVIASELAEVDIRGAAFGAVANDAVRAFSGATVYAGEVTTTVAGVVRDGIVCGASKVFAESISLLTVGGIALKAFEGGEIIAPSAVCTNAGGAAAVQADTGARVSAVNVNAANAAGAALLADNGSYISAQSADGSGAGTYGAFADMGSEIIAPESDLSGAGTSGATATNGSRASLDGTNCQSGGSPASTDCQVGGGSIIAFQGGTGGTNVTINSLSAQGIIFQ